MNKNRKERHSMNGVIITVYVESATIRSHRINDPLKRMNPNPFAKRPQSARTRGGYDRKAQLLAYARELRDADSQQLDWPKNNPRPKPKKWRWSTSPARLRLTFRRIFQQTNRRWRYERLVLEEKTEVDRSCGPKSINGKKPKATKRTNSRFCRRLRCMLKGLSCGWQCNKG